eukprot:795403_1
MATKCIAFDEDETNLTNLRVDDFQEDKKIQINGLHDNDYDSTLTTKHLDGEYQKQGHTGLWNEIYRFVDVSRNVVGESSWKWVIGTDYNDI